jgi:pimeloyl-ACP methyl ester carboxylesterase
MIDRGFVRTGAGQIHYRSAGRPDAQTSLPLIMAHGGPGSSAGLAPLMSELSADRRVIAPDMMGNGESDPPPSVPTDIKFYADGIVDVMDRMGIARADFYGHHTGAQVVCELAIAHPGRVRCLVLDGVALFAEDALREYRELYAPPIVPDSDGAHLQWVWNFIRHTTQFFPHYKNDADHAIAGGITLPPDMLTARTAEVLKVWSTYHIAYDAAFRHPVRKRLPLLRVPALVLETAGDPLSHYAAQAVALIAQGRKAITTRAGKGDTIRAFLRDADK